MAQGEQQLASPSHDAQDMLLLDNLLQSDEQVEAFTSDSGVVVHDLRGAQAGGASTSSGGGGGQGEGEERVVVSRLPSPEAYWQQQRPLMLAWAGASAATLVLLLATFGVIADSLLAAFAPTAIMGMAAWVGLFGPMLYFGHRAGVGGSLRRHAKGIVILGGLSCFVSAGMGFTFLFTTVGHALGLGVDAEEGGAVRWLAAFVGLALVVAAHVADFLLALNAALRMRNVGRLLDPVSSGLVVFA